MQRSPHLHLMPHWCTPVQLPLQRQCTAASSRLWQLLSQELGRKRQPSCKQGLGRGDWVFGNCSQGSVCRQYETFLRLVAMLPQIQVGESSEQYTEAGAHCHQSLFLSNQAISRKQSLPLRGCRSA